MFNFKEKPVSTIAMIVLPLWIAFVFVQSLFFKFSNAKEPQHIFGTLEKWGTESLGISGLFAPSGIFSQYVIGGAELVASIMLLIGILPALRLVQGLGAVLALAIMSGAIFFHLATPLGVEVLGDGGTLFYMACAVWVSALILIVLHRQRLLGLLPFGGKARAA
jgi:uncharacterized membrane protein YphA (DoxX/SURF4 family)